MDSSFFGWECSTGFAASHPGQRLAACLGATLPLEGAHVLGVGGWESVENGVRPHSR